MKKILYTGVIMLGTLSLVACDSNTSTNTTDSERVVERDSVATEYEVTETVVDYDTTTKTKSVDVDRNKRDND